MPFSLHFYSFVSFSLFLCYHLFLSDLPPLQLKVRLWWIEPAATAHLARLRDLRVPSQCVAASATHRTNTSVMQPTENRLLCHERHTPTRARRHKHQHLSPPTTYRHPLKLGGWNQPYFHTDWHTYTCRGLLYVTSCQPPPHSSDVYTTAHQAGKSKERSPQTQGALRLLLYQSPLMISICSPLC